MNTAYHIIERNEVRKLQVLFVHSSTPNYLYDLHDEIEFDNVTVGDALSKISEEEICCDAVVVDAAIDPAGIIALRKLTTDKDLPLIFYTSFFEPKMRDKAVKLKADDYVYGSVRYTFASRIKLIKQLRKFKIQWLKQESKYKLTSTARSTRWQFLQTRILDIVVCSVAFILFSPAILIVAFAQEIGLMRDHAFSDFRDQCLIFRIFAWYQFIVLILFSPIFVVIKMPSRLKPKQPYRYPIDKSGSARFDQMLIKTIQTGTLQLISILKGDNSLFGAEPLDAETRTRNPREASHLSWAGTTLSPEMKR